eukprot:scaffold870_cov268-Pinguiococcus_pyrenoidosus.AAC.58
MRSSRSRDEDIMARHLASSSFRPSRMRCRSIHSEDWTRVARLSYRLAVYLATAPAAAPYGSASRPIAVRASSPREEPGDSPSSEYSVAVKARSRPRCRLVLRQPFPDQNQRHAPLQLSWGRLLQADDSVKDTQLPDRPVVHPPAPVDVRLLAMPSEEEEARVGSQSFPDGCLAVEAGDELTDAFKRSLCLVWTVKLPRSPGSEDPLDKSCWHPGGVLLALAAPSGTQQGTTQVIKEAGEFERYDTNVQRAEPPPPSHPQGRRGSRGRLRRLEHLLNFDDSLTRGDDPEQVWHEVVLHRPANARGADACRCIEMSGYGGPGHANWTQFPLRRTLRGEERLARPAGIRASPCLRQRRSGTGAPAARPARHRRQHSPRVRSRYPSQHRRRGTAQAVTMRPLPAGGTRNTRRCRHLRGQHRFGAGGIQSSTPGRPPRWPFPAPHSPRGCPIEPRRECPRNSRTRARQREAPSNGLPTLSRSPQSSGGNP